MRKPLLGFLFAMACAAAGFLLGRHKRAESLRLHEAARAVQPSAPLPVPVETEPAPPDLPTDQRSGDSVPRGLE